MSYYPPPGNNPQFGKPAGPPGNYPAPPSGYAPPNAGGFAAPPVSGAPGMFNPASGAPSPGVPPATFRPAGGMSMPPPPSNFGMNSPAAGSGAATPTGGAPSTGRPGVQFFSTSTGAPVQPTPPGPLAHSMPPPPSGMGPPPTGMGGPPTGPAPPMMGPPGSMYGAPPTGPPGGPMGGPPPPSGYPAHPGHPGPPGPPAGPAGIAGGLYAGLPAGFDSSQNLQNINQGMQPGGPQGMQPGGPAPGAPTMAQAMQQGQQQQGGSGNAPLPLLQDMDLSIQCNPAFLRCTVGKITQSQQAAGNSKIPLGLVCKPMAGDVGTDNEEIEVVDFGSTGIVRCKRCRSYINPYVTWTDNGRRWRCNICGMLNDVPSTYFSHLDNNGYRRDRDQRPELSRCSVEFVAPGDYMVRPPQPPVYFFVIDVSEPAIQSGMLYALTSAIKNSLDNLPGNKRTQIGFITFDSHIHFYNIGPKLHAPRMMVVSDLSDPILPLPEDILVNLSESRGVVEALLDSLPTMFKPAGGNVAAGPSAGSCLGSALLAARRVIQHVGGKLCIFQSQLPTVGEGALKMRDNPRLLGSDKEHIMLQPETEFYKREGTEMSKQQICADTFFFAAAYTDLATISVLSKYTGGSTYYYPNYYAPREGTKFEADLTQVLTRPTAFEAVMRIRATRGIRFTNFYGNYSIRGTDLLALPNCNSDSTFALDMAYDENMLETTAVTIQAALLYTNAFSERRIRVHTMVLPVCQNPMEMVETLDINCMMNILGKQAVDIAQKTGMDNARQRMNQLTMELLRANRVSMGGAQPGGPPGYGPPGQQGAGQFSIPSNLMLLPLYSMSLQKSFAIRGGNDIRVDERAYFQQLLSNMDVEESTQFIYPRMYSLHDMEASVGLPSDNADEGCPTAGPNQVRLPNILNLSYERLNSQGIFMLENGHDMFMWIGRQTQPAILNTLFGFNSLEGVEATSLKLFPENSDFSTRVQSVIDAIRSEKPAHYMQLHFIKEGDGYAEAYFARYLVEDRANFQGGGSSYAEFHQQVSRALSGGMPGGPMQK